MPIRWKLLIILLTVAVPPMVLISWFDQISVRGLGRELTADNRKALMDGTGARLLQATRGHAEVLRGERAAIDLALRLQAERLEKAFATGDGGAADRGAVREALAGLARELPGLLEHQVVRLADGRRIEWPQRVARDAAGAWIWREIEGGGAVGARIAPATLIARLEPPADLAADLRLMVVAGEGGAVLAARGGASPAASEVPEGALGSEPAGFRRAVWDGQPSLVAWAPVAGYGVRLVAVLPEAVVDAAAQPARQRVGEQLARLLAVNGTGLVVFAVVAVLLSLLGARSITHPVALLGAVARRISEGDLDARADIRSGDELQELGESFNAMLPKLQDRIRMREALGLAMEVQQQLLPAGAPDFPGLELAGRSLYCDETGGDYFDFLELTEPAPHKLGIAVGDVTGHGVAAALLMTTARALLRGRAGQPEEALADMMTHINSMLSQDTSAGRFMTLFYLVVDRRRGALRWVSAGHEPALLLDPATGEFTELGGEDIPLGIAPDWRFNEAERRGWRAGELLLIGTDGIWEARAPSGEMFGRQRLRAVVRDNADRPVGEICDAIARSVTAFRGERPQEDDATLVIARFLDAAAPLDQPAFR